MTETAGGRVKDRPALSNVGRSAAGESVELAFVDQGYSGKEPAKAAQEKGIRLEVVKLPEAKREFVLLPRRWIGERSFAWMSRFRRLARDYECLPETLAALHFVAFAGIMVARAVAFFHLL